MKFLQILLQCIFCVLFLTACQNEEPIVIKFPKIPDPTIELVSVYIGNGESSDNDTPSHPLTPPVGEGTKDSPYNCAAVINLNNPGTDAWVKGYIVGYYDYNSNSSLVSVGGPSASNSNIALADYPNETDMYKTVSVQLQIGDLRSAVNLVDHPENIGKMLTIQGSLTKYFGLPGVKNTTDFFFEEGNNDSRETKPNCVNDKSRVNDPEFIYDKYNGIEINIIAHPLYDEPWYWSYDRYDWELQEMPTLIDLTTNSTLDVNYYCDDERPGYDLYCSIWTVKGVYFLPGHTYEVTIKVATSINIDMDTNLGTELEEKYGVYLYDKDITATYSKKLTFTVPNE